MLHWSAFRETVPLGSWDGKPFLLLILFMGVWKKEPCFTSPLGSGELTPDTALLDVDQQYPSGAKS